MTGRATTPGTLLAADFLALADQQVVRTAVMVAAEAVADGCALQIRDPNTGRLRVARHRGLPYVVLEQPGAALPHETGRDT